MKITYFVHGTTTDNEAGIATGWIDGELSELGKQQSDELYTQIIDPSFSIVFASDLWRAVDTAQRVFSNTHEIRLDKRLREANYGDLNGKPHTFKNNMQDFISSPFPNGESYQDVEVRIRAFIEDTKNELGSDAHIAIVAHEAPQLALEVIANNKSWQQAIDKNWRRTKSWQPGWIYEV